DVCVCFFFSSRRRHTRSDRDWSSDVCSSDLTIGVAKRPLVGRVTKRGHPPSGAMAIEFQGRVRGYAWTPPGRERPIFVSIGHRITLARALEVVRASTLQGHPEPLKLADRIGREMKRNKRNEKRKKGATR